MSRLFFLKIYVVLIASGAPTGAKVTELSTKREALERRFEQVCGQEFDFFRRSPHQALLYLKDQRFDANGDTEQTRVAELLGGRLFDLANVAVKEKSPALAYDLLHEANFFHHETAGKIVGQESTSPKAKQATATHSNLRWKRKTYFLVTSDHFQVATKDRQEGIDLAIRLEQLHAVWSQLFFTHWSDNRQLAASIERGTPLEIKRRLRHKVVLFPSREAYIDFLAPRQPRIEISLGFYDIGSKTSYFFTGDDSTRPTQLHEVTHQLFQELTGRRRPRFANNFWAIEGIAMYMESMLVDGPVAIIGGVQANRLQFARFRRLQEGFYVPLDELSKLGQNQLQRDQRIRRIYSQAAGLSHFLMHSEDGGMRRSFIEYLRDIYTGKSTVESLSDRTNLSFPQLAKNYVEFLRVQRSDLLNSRILPDSIVSLCLGDTQVADVSLSQLGSQKNLDWLDLARTRVSDEGLAFLKETGALRQLSLDGTTVTDASCDLICRNSKLEELDLSNTRVTSAGIRKLKLPLLKTLWLSNTRVDDSIVGIIMELKALEFLALDGTGVAADAKSAIKRANPNLTIQ